MRRNGSAHWSVLVLTAVLLIGGAFLQIAIRVRRVEAPHIVIGSVYRVIYIKEVMDGSTPCLSLTLIATDTSEAKAVVSIPESSVVPDPTLPAGTVKWVPKIIDGLTYYEVHWNQISVSRDKTT
ncbi:MAG: hypothetical protein K0S20_376 [Patescibacteria group bacterium]|nr:hypothetical protein [Patescibacteria group bacterium]